MASENKDEEFVDITDLFRRCASQCLSYSHPFTPLSRDPAVAASLGNQSSGGVHDGKDSGHDAVMALLGGLRVQGKSIVADIDGGIAQKNVHVPIPNLFPLDLQDAMTALELGDKRMDCCEIPLVHDEPGGDGDNDESPPKKPMDYSSQVTFPPRIAPTSLSDGTTTCTSLPSNTNAKTSTTDNDLSNDDLSPDTLLLPSTPCPSLLTHWDDLSLSPTSLLPLVILQLTALEAYIGTNNGGSNAAETLYCMMWFHDGVLADMSKRLGVDVRDSACNDLSAGVKSVEESGMLCQEVNSDGKHNSGNTMNGYKAKKELEYDELTVARWALFASSLGVVRIAEAVRWVVVNADFYEEEDFGITLHGEKATTIISNEEDDEKEYGGMTDQNNASGTTEDDGTLSSKDGTSPKKERRAKKGGSSMRFCPALQGSQYIEVVWDTALSYLRLYRTSLMTKDNVDEKVSSTIDALETILLLQQSFFQAIKILSNLNDETVVDFTKIAVKRSRETVSLLEKLRDNVVVAELSKDGGFVGIDGQLIHGTSSQPQMDLLLSASFDPFVNRRLLGNAPVRKACFRRPLDVLSSLSQLTAELEWGVCDPILYGNTFGRITRMLEKNSLRGCGGVTPIAMPKKKKESSNKKGQGLDVDTPVGMNVLSRSLVVLNLYFDDKLFGQHDFSDMIGQHMRQQCAVPDLLLESTCPNGGLAWLTRLAKPMYDTLKSLCLNRHRERGFTESILLPAFQLLQYEAANVDDRFRKEHGLDAGTTPSYATNYIILNTIRLMERHVGLGIELGLYPNWYDLSTALWYRDFLLSALINVRGSIERERTQRREMNLRIKMEQEEEERKSKAQLQQQQTKKKGKTKKGKKSKQPSAPAVPAPDTSASTNQVSTKPTAEDFEDRLDYTGLLLHRNLCRGLVRYIAALRQANLLHDPPASITMFTTHQKRFEKRFEAFSTLPQPPSLSYEDYVRGSDFSAVQSKDLLASATECFRTGKGVVDWLLDVVVSSEDLKDPSIDVTEKRRDDDLYISIRREEIMALAKVCVTNSLFLHKLASAAGGKGQNLGSSGVTLEFKAHKQYCTLRIA